MCALFGFNAQKEASSIIRRIRRRCTHISTIHIRHVSAHNQQRSCFNQALQCLQLGTSVPKLRRFTCKSTTIRRRMTPRQLVADYSALQCRTISNVVASKADLYTNRRGLRRYNEYRRKYQMTTQSSHVDLFINRPDF